MDGSPQDSRLAGFDRLVRRTIAAWGVPGLVVGLVEGGRTIFAKGYGLRDVKRGLPVRAQTLLGIGSCTKAFTATALAMLVEEGALGWDTPVADVLPGFALHDPAASRQATPRDLLTHRCGLPGHNHAWITSPETRLDFLKRVRHLPANRGFRAAYQYSNMLYMVAGVLIEHLTGRTWEQFVQERILQPLGMADTRCLGPQMHGEIAVGYERLARGLVRWRCPGPSVADACTLMGPMGPAGSIYSNVPDMCRWLAFQMRTRRGLHGGRGAIVGPRMLQEIHAPQIVCPPDSQPPELLDASYALGWIVRAYRGRRWVHHYGSFAGFTAVASFLPDQRVGAVVLSNLNGPKAHSAITSVSLSAYDRLLGLEGLSWNTRLRRCDRQRGPAARKPAVKRIRGTCPSHPLADYAGRYHDPGYGPLTVCLDKGLLTLRRHGIVFRLRHWHYDVFEMSAYGQKMPAAFQSDKSGRIASVAIPFEPTVPDIVFRRIASL